MSDVSRSDLEAWAANLRLELERSIDEAARHQTRARTALAADLAAIRGALKDPDGWVRIAFHADAVRLTKIERSMRGVTRWMISIFTAVISLLTAIVLLLLSLYLSGAANIPVKH